VPPGAPTGARAAPARQFETEVGVTAPKDGTRQGRVRVLAAAACAALVMGPALAGLPADSAAGHHEINAAGRLLAGLTAAPSGVHAQAPAPSGPAPAAQPAPAQPVTPTAPAQPVTPTTPAQPVTPTAPAQPVTPTAPAQPPPPSPFVPQPGVPPQVVPPQRVVDVVVQGNVHVPAAQVLNAVSTKPNDALNEEKLRNDVQAILATGLFADAVVRLEPVPEGVRVVFVVVENPVITSVVVQGNTVEPTADIVKALGVQTGQVLNTVVIREGARAVERLYQDRGYILARVSDVAVNEQGVLTITLAEGRIEAVKIEGLHKTKDFVVRRELTFKPGDVFNANAVNASLKRLFQLQYFSDVKAQPGPGTTPDTVDVTIIVTEQKTASIGFGAGYSTVGGLQGILSYRDANFGGNGQAVLAQYNSSALNGGGYTLSFHEPYFLGTRTAMDLQAFNVVSIPTDYSLGLNNAFNYNMYQTGGSATFLQPLTPARPSPYSLSYGFKYVNTTFGQPSLGTSPPAGFLFTPGIVSAVLLGGIKDTRDDPLDPTTGEHVTLSLESAVSALAGNFDFEKYELDYARFFPLAPGTVIVGHMHLGSASGPLPLQEQYYLGGQTTLRGYASGRFRGDEVVLLTGEYHFPLSTLPLLHTFTGLTGIVFADAGDAEPFGSGFNFNVKTDYGIGLAIKTGFGPFRLDYGFSPEGNQLWISTGVTF
jgi:outer membrane protein insertion porin family